MRLSESGRYFPSLEEAIGWGEADMVAIARHLPDDRALARILEVGCGCGNLVLSMGRAGYRMAEGIDRSAELVAHGRNVLGARIRVGDWLEFMESGSDLLDAVVALDVFEHLEPGEALRVLRATRARLSPNGRFIMRTPNAECPLVLPTFAGDLTHRLLATPGLVRDTLREAGFLGQILFWETRPYTPYKRWIFTLLHRLLVRPVFALVFFHFHQRFPEVITRNMYCCAYAQGRI